MLIHPRVCTEQLASEDCAAIHDAALRILEETGLTVQSAEACRFLAEAGAQVAGAKVRFPRDVAARLLKSSPERFTLHARNAERNVEVGGNRTLVSPGYGSAFVADRRGMRRNAVLDDFRKFALLAGWSEAIDITGGLLVEPLDVPPAFRPAEITRLLLACSDKPFLGSVAGAEGARDTLAMLRIALGSTAEKPAVMALINVNSPLRLDAGMADAMLEYVKAGQAVLLTPGILQGVTAPVTTAGALAQAFAELIGGAALAQAVRPGAPVVIGLGGFGADLRTGGSGFGRPENALATITGAQMARRLGLPFRCSAAVTGSRLPDCRSGYERMMTAMAAWSAGAHVCLQAAGILDCINSMCFEQFLIDLEVWGYLRRLAERPRADPDRLALDVIASAGSDYLGHEHTLEHMRDDLYTPQLASPDTFDAWAAAGGEDVAALAAKKLAAVLPGLSPPPIDPGAAKELDRYVQSVREKR